MIDFDALVLNPLMGVFGQPVMVTPTASQPGHPAYPARGIWSSRPVDVVIEGTDQVHSTNQPMLGVRLSDFPVSPKPGDFVTRAGTSYAVIDLRLDGQGGADLLLREASPP